MPTFSPSLRGVFDEAISMIEIATPSERSRDDENMKSVEKHLLSQMLLIRMVEEAIAREYASQEMRCPTHLCIGQEAIAVGVCAALSRDDVVFSTHRSHGHYLARGGSLPAMIAELYGKATGAAGGIGGSQHLVDRNANFWGAAPIVASMIPVAVGATLAFAMKREKRLAVCFFGDAATEEGVFYESINYAALRRLPVLFVCEDNHYSTNTPIRQRQPDRSLTDVVRAMGVGFAKDGDGNDVMAVKSLAAEAVSHIREIHGPAFLTFTTYRVLEHCGPLPDPPGFRPQEEKARWAAKDPIRRYRRTLLGDGTIRESDIDAMKKRIEGDIARAFAFAKASPFPVINQDIGQLVYKVKPSTL